jgi:hypothetical protein
LGLAWGSLAVAGVIVLPAWWIFRRCRERWHSTE